MHALGQAHTPYCVPLDALFWMRASDALISADYSKFLNAYNCTSDIELRREMKTSFGLFNNLFLAKVKCLPTE